MMPKLTDQEQPKIPVPFREKEPRPGNVTVYHRIDGYVMMDKLSLLFKQLNGSILLQVGFCLYGCGYKHLCRINRTHLQFYILKLVTGCCFCISFYTNGTTHNYFPFAALCHFCICSHVNGISP